MIMQHTRAVLNNLSTVHVHCTVYNVHKKPCPINDNVHVNDVPYSTLYYPYYTVKKWRLHKKLTIIDLDV